MLVVVLLLFCEAPVKLKIVHDVGCGVQEREGSRDRNGVQSPFVLCSQDSPDCPTARPLSKQMVRLPTECEGAFPMCQWLGQQVQERGHWMAQLAQQPLQPFLSNEL